MKNTRKFAAMMAALTLSACSIAPMISSAAPASAGHTITIKNSADSATHTYAAYQIFSGTYDTDAKNLTDIQWGTGVNGDAIISDLKADSLLRGYFATCTSAQDVADVLNTKATDSGTNTEIKVFEYDSDLTKAFAKVVGRNLTDVTSGTYDNGKITGLEDGYYLVQDASNPTMSDNVVDESEYKRNSGAKTRFIVSVVGSDIEVTSKSSAPLVFKKVKENFGTVKYKQYITDQWVLIFDDNYNDIADYNIGNDVPFRLYGTLPSTYADYEHYYYKFTDNLGSQFTLADDASFKISVNGNEVVTLKLNGKKAYDSSLGTDIFIDASDNSNISITIEDIKKIAPNISDVITVDYVAKLNKDAVIGLDGQVNGVKLDYSNNPNIEYNPKTGDEEENDKTKPEYPKDTKDDKETEETGSTPWDGVIVFTYGIDIDKLNEKDEKLAGAKFAIYKEKQSTDATTDSDTTKEKIYLGIKDGEVVELKTAPTKETDVGAENGVWVSDVDNNIEIRGLDAGTYYIEELEAPADYNALKEDIQFNISPTIMSNRQEWMYSPNKSTAKKALTKLEIKYASVSDAESDKELSDAGATAEDGYGTVKIVNKKGSELPSTGGIGTKIFYLGGGCMVAVAGIFLITKKRMGKEEN